MDRDDRIPKPVIMRNVLLVFPEEMAGLRLMVFSLMMLK